MRLGLTAVSVASVHLHSWFRHKYLQYRYTKNENDADRSLFGTILNTEEGGGHELTFNLKNNHFGLELELKRSGRERKSTTKKRKRKKGGGIARTPTHTDTDALKSKWEKRKKRRLNNECTMQEQN